MEKDKYIHIILKAFESESPDLKELHHNIRRYVHHKPENFHLLLEAAICSEKAKLNNVKILLNFSNDLTKHNVLNSNPLHYLANAKKHDTEIANFVLHNLYSRPEYQNNKDLWSQHNKKQHIPLSLALENENIDMIKFINENAVSISPTHINALNKLFITALDKIILDDKQTAKSLFSEIDKIKFNHSVFKGVVFLPFEIIDYISPDKTTQQRLDQAVSHSELHGAGTKFIGDILANYHDNIEKYYIKNRNFFSFSDKKNAFYNKDENFNNLFLPSIQKDEQFVKKIFLQFKEEAQNATYSESLCNLGKDLLFTFNLIEKSYTQLYNDSDFKEKQN